MKPSYNPSVNLPCLMPSEEEPDPNVKTPVDNEVH